MRSRFVKMLRREEGFTLIELIAVLSLTSMVLGIISTTLFFGFRSYHQVSAENKLREEGDILMSAIITELYVFSPDRIYALPGGSGFRMLHVTEDGTEIPAEEVAVEIVEGQLQIRRPGTAASADPYQTTRTDSQIVPGVSTMTIEGERTGGFEYYTTGLINIKLALELEEGSGRSGIDLESRFGF
ncbi:type II secretion system protein [Saccharibacillus deserti]|uniref:type II secretion system protein n=1 Tax=Saccharibacillus deserti TaxID=1634444 RepID=UPI0015518A42|nr:type II secretion system protein [Saccharibacillus deserti]